MAGQPAAVALTAAFAYHDVTDDPRDSGFAGPGAMVYKHDWATFAKHLDALAGAAMRGELVTAIDFTTPGRRLLLTFDDGGRSAVEIGDELCRRGWLGHFFVTTDRIGTPGFLDAPQIRYLRGCGHIVGSHSHTHPDIFRELTRDQMMSEWRISCDRLADLLGEPCITAAVPGGDISPLVLASAGPAGLRYLFTCEPTLTAELVDGCWMVGRFSPKAATPAARIGQLARFNGWGRAMLVRRVKNFVRAALPGPYRYYVQRQSQRPLAKPG